MHEPLLPSTLFCKVSSLTDEVKEALALAWQKQKMLKAYEFLVNKGQSAYYISQTHT